MRRSPGFGSYPFDSPPLKTAALARRLRPCRFPYAFPDAPVRLAKQVHSLARFSKRTIEHRLPEGPTTDLRPSRSQRGLLCPIVLSPPDFKLYFTSLWRILFSVRSRYLFTIGLGEYLALAVDACHLHEGIPTPDTLELTHAILDRVTGLSPCIVLRFRRLHADVLTMIVSPNTTLPVRASVWAVPRPLAVTNGVSLRFLFLSVLRCFNSGRSPLRKAIAVRIPIRRP